MLQLKFTVRYNDNYSVSVHPRNFDIYYLHINQTVNEFRSQIIIEVVYAIYVSMLWQMSLVESWVG